MCVIVVFAWIFSQLQRHAAQVKWKEVCVCVRQCPVIGWYLTSKLLKQYAAMENECISCESYMIQDIVRIYKDTFTKVKPVYFQLDADSV